MGILINMRRNSMKEYVPPTPEPQYIQNGLIFWLDGIKNTPNGHDATSANWYDLADNTRYAPYPSSAVIGDDYCIPNVAFTLSKQLTISTGYTIEIVINISAISNSQMILPNAGNNFGTVWIATSSSGNRIYFSAGNSNGAKGTTRLSGINTYTSIGKTSSSFYRNGSQVTWEQTSATWSTAYRSTLFDYSSSYSRPCKSKVYCIRIYNRTLSASEINENYLVDKARFGSGV